MRLAYGVAVVLVFSTAAMAQPEGAGHGSVTAGLFTASDDSTERARFPDGPSTAGMLFMEAVVFVLPRIGVGAEALSLGMVTGSYDAACCILRDQEQETAIFVTGRWRPLKRKLVGIDAVLAVGTVLQHRETRTSLRFVANSARNTIEDRHSPAWGVGVDVPLSIVPHIAISPLMRVYFLDRGERDTPNVVFAPSTRFAIGIIAGVSW